jgi:hypothetical protein
MRRLAYSSSPGHSWPEDVWVRSRQFVQGLTKEAAEAEIAADIEKKRIIVIQEAA